MKIRFKKNEKREKFNVLTILLLVFLCLYALSMFIVLGWGILTSFKYQWDFRLNVIGFPEEWAWNYGTVAEHFYVDITTDLGTQSVYVPKLFMNGFLYALGCAFTNTLIPCITAYMCAKFPYKYSKVLYSIVIVTMILPIVGSMPSEIQVAKFFGLYDQIWGLWLMKANFLGMYFLVFHGMAKSIPNAYSEAAKIDGAGNLTILVKIVFPIIKNTFLTVMLINFITFWNDYSIPQVYLPSYPTIAFGVLLMSMTTINDMSTIPMRMTSAIMALAPVLILFLCFHKKLLGNLTIGGIKG
jgi:raffinose/stachyose/melibiose transport system permease protein